MGIKNSFIKLFDNERYIRVETLYGNAKEKHFRGFTLFNSFNNIVDLPDDFDYKEYVGEHIDIIIHYDGVLNQYDDIKKNWEEGLIFYVNERKMHMPNNHLILNEASLFPLKEQIVKNYQTIKEYTSIIRNYNLIKRCHCEGLTRFVRLYPSLHTEGTIGFMKHINSNERTIKVIDNVIKQYNRLLSNRKEAIRLFLNTKDIVQVDYSIKEKVVFNEGRIDQINQTLREYKSIRTLNPNAVGFYLTEHAPDLQSFTFIKNNRELFQTAEFFYNRMSEKLKKTLFLFDLSEKDLTSVSLDNHKAKQDFLKYLSMKTDSHYKPVFSMENDITVFFDYIQDSANSHTFQRDKENLSDLCDIARVSNQNTYALNQVSSLVSEKKDAILSYYKMKGKATTLSFSSIIDYFTDKDLGKYIEQQEKEKDIRSNASYIANQYRKGFKACCPSSFCWGENWTIEQCMEVINKKDLIIRKNQDIEDDERRKRQQEEREREERLRRQREAEKNRLLSKLSHWHTNRYGIKHMWMYAYLPTNCGIYANDEEWGIRNLIWAFKNNPSKPARHCTYSEALNIIVKNSVLILEKDLGSDLSKITLVCVPSSNKVINEKRYKAFSEQLCKETGMTNAFSKIEIIQDAIPKREGGTTDAVLRFDNSFFKNRYILIFDDIMTTGRSVEHLRQQMNQMGAMTIGALTIGKTVHDHVSENPISIYKRFFRGV